MSGRPFRGGRRGGGFFPRAQYRGRGRGFWGGGSYEGRGRGRGRGSYGYNKRYDDDRDRDRYSRDRYYSRSRSRSRSKSRSRSRSYSRSRSRSSSRSKTPQAQRESRARKLPTKKELQEIAAAVTKSIVQDKEQRLRSKTPVRTRSGFADSPPALPSTRRSLSPVRGDGGNSPFSSSREYPVSRPKTPSLKQKNSSEDGGFRDYPVSRPKTPSLRAKDSSGDGGFRAQLLELALKEKQKLGLDKLDSPRSSSSALKAIQGYSGTRSPEESDHEEEPIATDLYDDLPKPLFPISNKDLYDDLLTESHVNSRSESKHHSEDSRTQRQSSMLIPGLGIDENIDDEDAFLYGDEGLSTGRPPSGPERRPAQEKQPFVEERKHAPQDSWMPAPQRFGGRPPSPEDSDLTIDLKLPFDRRKGAESARPGKEFPESRAQRQEQPVPQRGGRRAPDRIFDEPSPMDSWKSSQRHRTPSPEQSSPPLSSRATKQPPKQSMLGYSSIESMKQELRELKMMLSREKEAKEESHERKRPRTPSDAGSYNRGGRSPSPAKRRRDSYSPSHRRRGRSPPDNYRRPSPPSYRRERRESPYYRGAATPSARRYSPSPANSLSPSSDRSVGKRWSPSPPPRTPRHRRQEGRTPGRRWSPDSPPPRPRRSSLERTPKHPSSQTPYYQGSSQPTQPPYYDSGQPSGPPLVPPPNLSVPPPNFTMNAPPPQVPYFAGYPPPAQAPPDFSYPPPSTQPQQQAMRSNLRVVPLQSAVEGGPVKEETSFSPVNVKQEEKTVSKKLPPVTQEEIDHYLSLVETKDSHREKLTLLKQELVRIGKIQNEMMRRRQHKR
ncbi:hypothetical protein HPB50_025713 [Hyalomma asiaticum]|uniref:Uncharacterized protein n=1 Tax=Hyalomma asiaticum TaxID=266040 RepID=A0ACB7RSR1_HYAAI|nr:hypothetical protein HPB50_025713 [Hyalomma asiaticum]